MKSSIVRIGNSKGIRIPKTILKQCHLEGEVEIHPRKNGLVVRSIAKPRSGWDDAFARMARKGDDVLLDGGSSASSAWDKTEWKW